MLTRLADLALRRPRRILLATLALFLVAAVFGAPVAGLLSTDGGFTDPDSESNLAAERLERLGDDDPSPRAIILVRGRVDDPAVRERVTALAREAREVDGVSAAPTYYDSRDRTLVARDERSTFIPVTFRASAEGNEVGEELRDRLEDAPSVLVGGPAVANPAIGEQVSEDLAKAEMLAFPLLFLLSLWVFRGVVAALLPLFVGVLTIFGTFLTLRLVHAGIDLSIFALNLAIAMGLGLAIDYSLFVVTRYREEIERHGPGGEALRATMRTAGKTVLFSAITVALALSALLVFPLKFLYSMGIAGAAAALIAGLVTVIALPALLALLGPRVNALAPARWKRPPASGAWHRLAHWVMRRAAPVATVTALLLILVGLPALGIKFTGVDASALGSSSSLYQVEQALRTEFPRTPTTPVIVAVDAPASDRAQVADYAASLRDIPGVVTVAEPRPLGAQAEGWTVDLIPRGRPFADETQDIVREVRSRGAPFAVQVTGESAEFVDQQSALGERLPLALALLALSTLVVLFVMTGSVILPIKALIMNLLTLSGAFGLLVLVFQDGRLEGLLDYTSQGALEATQPVVLFAVAFALSTDYGVFLLTRIKEARDAGHRNDEAVALGLERTGRIVTAAALLLSVALGAFATSQVIFIKQVGLGTVFAVLIDATLVRAFLVPSLMKLLGEWNWWAPGPLRRLHGRLRVAEA